MNKLLPVVVAAAFAASSFGVLAQDKKQEVKSAQGAAVTTPGKAAVTTATGKPKKENKGGALPKNQGKRKTEAQRMEKK